MNVGQQAKWLTLIVLLINAGAMLSPVINSGDSVVYAALTQHIAVHNDWTNLVLGDKDWLDKPHLPFWITAIFFKLGGVSAFTYILPGFLFHLIGAFFTYRVARLFFERNAAWLAVVVYVSAYQLMDTSIEVKAETYLTAFIMGACYYWLRYDQQSKLKYLLLGALLSAMAMMTKGLFTLITISSGLLCLWLYQKQWHKLVSAKWWLASALVLLFTAPELITLYRQFDAHPEKIVFGQTHVSGIKFFFWDGQFGRFFNTGPIQNRDGSPYFFLLIFPWAFLPWTAVFIAATYANARTFSSFGALQRSGLVFLYGAFLITFVLLSATLFQMDRYIVIILPFAAILCGKFLADQLPPHTADRALVLTQLGIGIALVALTIVLSIYVGSAIVLLVVSALSAAALIYGYLTRRRWRTNALVVYPLCGIAIAYVFLVLTTALTFTRIGVAYNVYELLANQPGAPIYVYQMDRVAYELALYSQAPCYAVDQMAQLPPTGKSYFLVIQDAEFASLRQRFEQTESVGEGRWAVHPTGLFGRFLRLAKGTEPLEDVHVVRVGGS